MTDPLVRIAAALERLLEGTHDPDIRVAGTLAAPLLTDLEVRIDAAALRGWWLRRSGHGGER